MGIMSAAKKTGKVLFNFKVKDWFGFDFIAKETTLIKDGFKNVFTKEQAERTETFDEAMQRLELTEQDLENRTTEFTRLFIIFILMSVAIFCYSIFISIKFSNIGGFFMGLAITVYCLTHAFRYHFWLFQIKHRKLGCTFKQWLNGK